MKNLNASNFCVERGLFKCVMDEYCINIKYLCDGLSDCQVNSDEQNCANSLNNNLDKYRCKGGNIEYIGIQLVCDFVPDCSDGSDEIDCCK